MTTALDLITDALLELGVVGAGDTVSPEDAAFGLRKLNSRLEVWSNARLTFPVLQELSVTLTGAASYTLGPGGSPAVSRPLSIDHATAIDSGGLEYPVGVLDQNQWDGIVQKDVTGGPPDYVWYRAGNTNGTVYVYPKATGYTLKLDVQGVLASFAATTTSATLPEGAAVALHLALADDMAAAYGKTTPPDVRRRAAGALHAYKRTNHVPIRSESFPARQSYIERGY